jgi:tetratricopeptide (TPR) repeat protein
LAVALLVLLTLLAYGRAGACGFVNFDDDEYVTANRHVQAGLTADGLRWAFTTFHAHNWHPLTWLSLQLDAALYGLDPHGFHRTNVLLHTAAAVLLFLALRALTGAVWRSVFVAALFALHPLHVESVAWVSERKDVLSAFFWFLTLLAYAHYAARPGLLRYALVLAAFALGLLAKPMLVTLPCVLLLLDYWPLRRLRLGVELPAAGPFPPAPWPRLVLEKLPLLALAAACAVLTVQAQERLVKTWDQFPLPVRLENALLAYAVYLGQTVCPIGLTVLYPHPGGGVRTELAVGAAVLLAALTLGALWLARQRPYLVVGWLWYLGTLVPVLGVVQVGLQARADRYTYIPLVGLFVALSWGAADLLDRLRWPAAARVALAGGVTALCVVGTWVQVGFWRDSETLWRHALAVTPDGAAAHNSLGAALEEKGEPEGALHEYLEAVRLDPDHVDARVNLGSALLAEGQPAAAEPHLAAAARLQPGHAPAHAKLGLALAQLGRADEAEGQYAEALRLVPEYAEAHNGLGVLLLREGRVREAVAHFEAALASRPDSTATRVNLGTALLRQGAPSEAAAQFTQAVQEDPDLAAAHNGLGVALARQGRWEEAVACDRAAVRLAPRDVQYRCNLALALHELGRKDAAAEYQAALALDPGWPEGHAQAAWILATHPDPVRRDAAEALQLATQACQATGSRRPEYVDALAAACAEAGRFDEAARHAREAQALAASAGKADLAARIGQRVRLYEDRRPFRDDRLVAGPAAR